MRLPIKFSKGGAAEQDEEEGYTRGGRDGRPGSGSSTAISASTTPYIQTMWDAPRGEMWVRLSAQVYLTIEDFEWGAKVLLELCDRLPKEWKKRS